MFVVFVDEETRRCKNVNFLKVERDGANGHFLVLTLAVDGVDSGFNFKRIRRTVEVAFRHLKLQFGNDRRAATGERVGAAWSAPLRVGPGGWKVGFEVKHHVDAAGGGPRVFNEEFHLHHSTGCK